MDISITAPKTRSLINDNESFMHWRKIIREQSQQYIYFRLGWLPSQNKDCKNCYVIYKGYVRGFFRIKGFINIVKGSEEMLKGRYVMLITESWREIKPIKAKGHRNFKYVEDANIIAESSKNLILQMYEELERRCQGQ